MPMGDAEYASLRMTETMEKALLETVTRGPRTWSTSCQYATLGAFRKRGLVIPKGRLLTAAGVAARELMIERRRRARIERQKAERGE